MKSLLRRHLVLLMLGVTAAAFTLSVDAPAFAKDGRSDDSGSGSSGSDNSGSGSHGGDDNSGSGGGDNDDSSGSSGDSDDNDSNDDSNNRSANNDDSNNRSASNDDRRNGGGGGGNNAARPRIQISVDAVTRAGLLNGTLVAVDNLGRPLEVEADIRNGQSVLIAKPHGGDAKRNPGPIASFNVVPAAQAPVHQ
jgi:hypothetical protein